MHSRRVRSAVPLFGASALAIRTRARARPSMAARAVSAVFFRLPPPVGPAPVAPATLYGSPRDRRGPTPRTVVARVPGDGADEHGRVHVVQLHARPRPAEVVAADQQTPPLKPKN
jgi:hypothetical protein